jgi:hypothetical protein
MNWKAKLGALRARAPSAVGGTQAFDRLAKGFLDLLQSPEVLTYSVLFIVEWTRP